MQLQCHGWALALLPSFALASILAFTSTNQLSADAVSRRGGLPAWEQMADPARPQESNR